MRYTGQDLKKLTQEERLALFRKWGAEAYGSDRWMSTFARDIAMSRRNVVDYSRGVIQVSIPVLLLLQEWAYEKTTPRILLDAIRDVSRDMESMANSMRFAANQITRNLNKEPERTAFKTPPEPPAPRADDHDDPSDEDDFESSQL